MRRKGFWEPARRFGPEVRLALGVGGVALLAMVASLVLAASLPAGLGGWSSHVVTSGSMRPALRDGDVVLTRRVAPSSIEPGAIVVFTDPAGHGLTVHRVVGRDGSRSFVTRGDANADRDSTPIRAEAVEGRVVLVVPRVGLLLPWFAGPRALVWAFGAAAAIAAVRRRRRRRPEAAVDLRDPAVVAVDLRDQPPPFRPVAPVGRGKGSDDMLPVGRRRRRPVGIRMGSGVLLLCMVAALSVVEGTGARFAVASATGVNAFAAAPFFPRYLKTDGPGNRTSTPILPLSTTAPTVATLPNYDTDRDAVAGLLLARSSLAEPLDETDATRFQQWDTAITSPVSASGPLTLTLWSAMAGFATNRKGAVRAGVYDCNGTVTSCTLVAAVTLAPTPPWAAGNTTWVEKTWSFGPVSYTWAASRVLRVKVVPTTGGQDSMLFAYDTTAYPSRLVAS